LPGITARGRVLATDTSKLDLTMYVYTWDDQTTTLAVEYSTDIFGPSWAEQFVRCLANVLDHAADAPKTPVADLHMLSTAERNALIFERNRPALSEADDTSEGGGDGVDVRLMLAASTSRVIDSDEIMPMSQVCDRAARIAHTLADSGVNPET